MCVNLSAVYLFFNINLLCINDTQAIHNVFNNNIIIWQIGIYFNITSFYFLIAPTAKLNDDNF